MTVTNLLSDLPDLIVSDITPTVTDVSWGETIDISWTVTNQGTGNTTSYWYDNIYFSVDENFDPNEDTSVGYWWDNNNLVAGSSYTTSTTITLPSSPIEGVNSGYLFVVSDLDNYQLETNENNNVSAAVAIDFKLPDLNDTPTLVNPIDDISTLEDESFNFTFPQNTFNDIDTGDHLTYTATTPSWLNFNPDTRTFSGT
ncbi:putative Ig domain-containing protein, partial [Anabaenopsis tanganyikae CS-531]